METFSLVQCVVCTLPIQANMEEIIQHEKKHKEEKDFVEGPLCVICGVHIEFKMEVLETHMKRKHRLGQQIPPSNSPTCHICVICDQKISVFPKKTKLFDDNLFHIRKHYTSHFENNELRRDDCHVKDQEIFCPFSTCFKTWEKKWSVYACLLSHLPEDLPIFHLAEPAIENDSIPIVVQVSELPSQLEEIGRPLATSTQVPISTENSTIENNSASLEQIDLDPVDCDHPPPRPFQLERTKSALFRCQGQLLFDLRIKHGVAEEVLNKVSTALSQMDSHVKEYMSTILQEEFSANPSSVNSFGEYVSAVRKRIVEEESLLGPEQLSSTYKRQKWYSKNYPIIPPHFVDIQGIQGGGGVGGGGGGGGGVAFFARFEIEELLKRFFKDKSVKTAFQSFVEAIPVFEKIQERKIREGCGGEIRVHSVLDGKRYKQKVRNREKTIVPIILYVDAFGVNDPAGSKSNLHKVTGIYLGVAATPTTYSERKSIMLIALIRQEDVSRHGIGLFLKQILEEIDLLRKVPFKIGDEEVEIELLYALADNLDANKIAGLGAGFSKFVPYTCRHCEYKTLQTVKSLADMREKSQPRTHQRMIHQQELYKQTRNKTLSKGVVSSTPLQLIDNFNLATDIPMCAVHNFHGG